MRDEAIALINEFLAENATQQITLPYANPFKNGLPPTATPAANSAPTNKVKPEESGTPTRPHITGRIMH